MDVLVGLDFRDYISAFITCALTPSAIFCVNTRSVWEITCIPSEPTWGSDSQVWEAGVERLLQLSAGDISSLIFTRSVSKPRKKHTCRGHVVANTPPLGGDDGAYTLLHIQILHRIATVGVKPAETYNSSCSRWNNVYVWWCHFHAWLFFTLKNSLSWSFNQCQTCQVASKSTNYTGIWGGSVHPGAAVVLL